MMDQIKIRKEQLDFLIRNVRDKDLSKKLIESLDKNVVYENNHKTNFRMLNIAFCEREKLLNELTFLITLNLTKNGELNKEGINIDNIIDIFSND
jgi:hypothetical protein